MFTDSGSYTADVAMGAFADLSEYIKETPGITDLIPTAYLDACKIDGKLYGIPAYKDSSTPWRMPLPWSRPSRRVPTSLLCF